MFGEIIVGVAFLGVTTLLSYAGGCAIGEIVGKIIYK